MSLTILLLILPISALITCISLLVTGNDTITFYTGNLLFLVSVISVHAALTIRKHLSQIEPKIPEANNVMQTSPSINEIIEVVQLQPQESVKLDEIKSDLKRVLIQIQNYYADTKYLDTCRQGNAELEGCLDALRDMIKMADNSLSDSVTSGAKRLASLAVATSSTRDAKATSSKTGIRLRQMQYVEHGVLSYNRRLLKAVGQSQEALSAAIKICNKSENEEESFQMDLSTLDAAAHSSLSCLATVEKSLGLSQTDVQSATLLVRGLSDRAEEIINIISVIDDIAEQTNQLALNASIEAMRAGVHGDGFAVVAAEVRALAAKSSQATRSITELLGTIQTEAKNASATLEGSQISVAESKRAAEDSHGTVKDLTTLAKKMNNGYDGVAFAIKKLTSQLGQVASEQSESSNLTKQLDRQVELLTNERRELFSENLDVSAQLDRACRTLEQLGLSIDHDTKDVVEIRSQFRHLEQLTNLSSEKTTKIATNLSNLAETDHIKNIKLKAEHLLKEVLKKVS